MWDSGLFVVIRCAFFVFDGIPDNFFFLIASIYSWAIYTPEFFVEITVTNPILNN